MTDRQGINKLFNLDVKSGFPALIIYSEFQSPRLQYTCKFIFNHVLKVSFEIITDRNTFQASVLPKINYSHQSMEGCLTIIPKDILNEKIIKEFIPDMIFIQDHLALFPSGGELGFDIFSSVFFMISRYEEWQPFQKDQHDRFELKESILFKNKAHLKPVVDFWIEQLKLRISGHYPEIAYPQTTFKVISTIDVDNLYAYKEKGITRTLGAMGKDVVKGNIKNLKRRLKVITGKENDPFDIYGTFSEFCKLKGIPLIYFFLFKTGTKYDRTLDPSSEEFRRVFDLIKRKNAFIGLHPSYHSSTDKEVMKSEISSFSVKSNNKVVMSRQHYLRFNIKTTPALLIENGIMADFTMGFASGPGFRAGTTHPFNYYDFNSESETELLMIPFCAMDGAYSVYKEVSAAEAFESLIHLKNEIRKLNGNFITVFHERTFDDALYPGYGNMYKELLSM